MRLCVTLLILFLTSISIDHQQTVGSQSETQVKTPEPNQVASSVSIHQPETTAKQNDPYDPRHDRLYRAYLAFTIIGVFVAMGAIVVFYLQTKTTQDAARAARFNAMAVVNSQRPWIAVRRKEPHFSNTFVFEVVCISGIPAKIMQIYADFQTVAPGESLQPVYKAEKLQYPYMLGSRTARKRYGISTATF